ncbi:hypothetical protein BGW80DRAFT_1460449 [Lactifluus volemus]|nr:hypothetical protein BGW80DRAFT_1460449 [Lactifluus volemus]
MAILGPAIQEGMLNTSECLRNRQISPIEALPDETLLTIFDFCRVIALESTYRWPGPWPRVWRSLVHVCQRWRYVVFSSPLRLDLRLYYSDRHGPSLRETLNVWPPFPIEICCYNVRGNLTAALEHRDHICELVFELSSSEWAKLARVTEMQMPFPALTCLRLGLGGWLGPVPALPATLIGGSAPSLRSFHMRSVTFPTLTQFLLSCNDLSELHLQDIPNLGYITPEAMVTVLSALTKLTCLEIGFKPERPREIRLAPPLTRALLPALTEFKFRGVNEYSEDILARINVPQLESLSVMYEHEPHVFDIPQLISHSLPLGPFHRAEVTFSTLRIGIGLYQSEETYSHKKLKLGFDHYAPCYQAESIAQMCTLSPLLPSVTELDIGSDDSFTGSDIEDLREYSNWLVLFRLFGSVRTLRLSSDIRRFVVRFILFLLLRHTGKGANGVLPELQNLYLIDGGWRDEAEEGAIERELLIAASQNSDHIITVHRLPYRD